MRYVVPYFSGSNIRNFSSCEQKDDDDDDDDEEDDGDDESESVQVKLRLFMTTLPHFLTATILCGC